MNTTIKNITEVVVDHIKFYGDIYAAAIVAAALLVGGVLLMTAGHGLSCNDGEHVQVLTYQTQTMVVNKSVIVTTVPIYHCAK